MTDTNERVVLVADDDAAVRQMLEMILLMEGYQVIVAADGLEAVQKYEEHRPDAVVLDIMMPKMDGLAVLEKIWEIHVDDDVPPVIIVSARGSDDDQWEGYRKGAAVYIEKPVEPNELTDLLKKLIR